MKIELLPHQVEALSKLKNGSVLNGGVGSGKSLTSLAYYLKDSPKRQLYIITTARKRDTEDWYKECDKMGIDISNVTVDSWNNIKKYTDVRNAFFIFDEQRAVGQKTRDKNSGWSGAFIHIARNCNNRWIMLSATPGDTWMDFMPIFLANGFYKNKTEFCIKHVIYKRFSKFPQIQTYINIQDLIRHKKDILVEMPSPTRAERIAKDIFVTYDKTAYFYIKKNKKNPETFEPLINASEYCAALRKISNTSEDRLTTLDYIYQKHKKVIVFYNFDYELDILKEWAASNSYTYAEWNGHSHDYIPATDSWLYLVQYTAGCEGWNCIECNCTAFYSASYSYKQMAQAAGRIDRLNTPFKELYYYYIWTDCDLDKRIREALNDKKSFNENKWINESRRNSE